MRNETLGAAAALVGRLLLAALFLALSPKAAPEVPARLCLRSGFACFNRIARAMGFDIPIEADPEAGISLTYADFLDAVDRMRGPPTSKITLTIKREGNDKPLELTLQREVIHIQAARARLEGDVGYRRHTQFNEQADAGIRTAVQKQKQQSAGHLNGSVADLRNKRRQVVERSLAQREVELDTEPECLRTTLVFHDQVSLWRSSSGSHISLSLGRCQRGVAGVTTPSAFGGANLSFNPSGR